MISPVSAAEPQGAEGIERESSRIAAALLDSLLGMLRLDFAYVRLVDANGSSPIEAARIAEGLNQSARPRDLGLALDRWLDLDAPASRVVVANPVGEGDVSIAPVQLGIQHEVGVLVAGSRRVDFPTEIEAVLLRMAAKEAAMGLQEARRLGERRREAEQLERRVAERTRQLTAVNKALWKEVQERKRVEQRLSTEHAVTEALAESRTLTEAMPHVLQAIAEGMDWAWGAFWIVDREADLLRCQGIWHEPDVLAAEFDETCGETTFTRGRSVLGQVWQSGEACWIADATEYPSFLRAAFASRAGLRAATAFPILLGGETLGVVELFSRRVRALDQEQLAAMCAIGSQIGQVIERKRAEETTVFERTRLASELHDTLMQGFTGVTLQLQAVLQRSLGEGREDAPALARALSLADATLREARQMVWDMRSPELRERAFPDALEHSVRRVVDAARTDLRFVVSGDSQRLAPAVETAVLRIAREAVTNAVKHADPRVVSIDLVYEPAVVRLSVRDDGTGLKGPEAEAAPDSGHWGIVGMRERAQRVGGTLEISSAPGRGTTVSLSIPAETSGHTRAAVP